MGRYKFTRGAKAFLPMLIGFMLWGVLVGKGSAGSQVSNHWRDHFIYLSPRPGAEIVSPKTTITFRGHDLAGPDLPAGLQVRVRGAAGGQMTGQLTVANDRQTVIFQPDQAFQENERVEVQLLAEEFEIAYTFQTGSWPDPTLDSLSAHLPDGRPSQKASGQEMMEPYKTAPPNLPRFSVNDGPGEAGEGFLFLTPSVFDQDGKAISFLYIADDTGEPVYYSQLDQGIAFDLKKQPDGTLTFFDNSLTRFTAVDNQYQPLRTYKAGNGYRTDGHDLQILENGHYLLLIYDLQTIDMSEIVEGGQPEAGVTGCIIQEIDADDQVVFEWRSWDHMDILDTAVDVTAEIIDYVHCNSVEKGDDGNILLSSRNLDEVTKIDRQSGDIIWRLGGKKNEFTYIGDVLFSRQHDARWLPDGHLTLFDNGNTHMPAHSRGIEIEIDEENNTATLIQEFRDSPDTYAFAMGNIQRLPNGNSVVGWGFSNDPVYTEFAGDGTKALEFWMDVDNNSGISYRTFRFPWLGSPSWPPDLVGEVRDLNFDLYFSWNGSTEVANYEIYTRDPQGQEMLLAQVEKDGFESSYSHRATFPGPWTFWVVAKDMKEEKLGISEKVVLLPGFETVFLPFVPAGPEQP